MIKKLFKGFIYFLGICALISILAAACEDEETTYIEHTGNVDVALSNTFGFGGHNSTVIFRRLAK